MTNTCGKLVLGLSNWTILTVVAGLLSSGCGGNPTSPAASNITIYKNGTYGTWFGESLAGSAFEATFSTVSKTDALTGDTQVLQINEQPGGAARFTISGAIGEDASSFVGGHLEFDVMLGANAAGQTLFPGFAFASTDVSTLTLSSTSFTHISLPFSTFGFTASTGQPNISVPFSFVIGNGPEIGTMTVYLNNIQWVHN